MILKKNEYLTGLDKLYKKYGITTVFSDRPGNGKYQRIDLYVVGDISAEAMDELMEYSADGLTDVYALYIDNYDNDIQDLYRFYSFGEFYGEVDNADGRVLA